MNTAVISDNKTSMKTIISDFKQLTKVGLSLSVVFSSVAGYLLAVEIVDYFILSRNNINFSTGICSIYNNLTKANKQNNSEENIRVRLNRVKEFYRDKVITSKEHGIVYTIIDY